MNSFSKLAALPAAALTLGLSAQVAEAAFQTFTTRAAFDAAVLAQFGPDQVREHNFDPPAITGSTPIPIVAGDTYDGITFTSWSILETDGTPRDPFIVGSPPPTTSSPNQIGIDVPGNSFQMRNSSSLTFDVPVDDFGLAYGVGLYVLTADAIDMFPDALGIPEEDLFQLSFGGETASISLADGFEVNPGAPGPTVAYFLGILFDEGVAPTVTLSSLVQVPGFDELETWFRFTVDDIVSVPVPGSIALIGLGLLAMRLPRRQAS